jgi:Ca-activated chloride channel homolog
MPESGDNLAPALDAAARLLRTEKSGDDGVVILSDGFADPAQALLAAKRLREQGATVQVVGVGTIDGAPLPNGKGQFVRDALGHTVLTRLQKDRLQRLAATGGGQYVPLSALSHLTAALQADQSPALSTGASATQSDVTAWLNGGVWLLPPLLLLTALVARKGWL